MTSTSAYLAACAAATQPLIRTVFFFSSDVPSHSVGASRPPLQLLRQFSISFAATLGKRRSSSACRPCSPCVIANAVSILTTPVSKSSSGTPSRQPVGHSSMQTRQPLQ